MLEIIDCLKNRQNSRQEIKKIDKNINRYKDSHIWPPEVAIFLALRVWEGIEAIQHDTYLNWY